MRSYLRIIACSLILHCLLTSVLALATTPAQNASCAKSFEDPYLWLEEIDSAASLDWVNGQNQSTEAELASTPIFSELFKEAKLHLSSAQQTPFSRFRDGYFWNFWQDENHPRGVLRRTSYDEYKKPEPIWEILLDLDELARLEQEDWAYNSGVQLGPNSSRQLLFLSRGGKDAVVVREYDIAQKRFIPDGFNVEEAKTGIVPLDENTVIIHSDFKADSLTTSGYPRFAKIWKRGEPLSAAKKIFEGHPSDLAIYADSIDHDGEDYNILVRSFSFWEHDYYLLMSDSQVSRKLPLPRTSKLLDICSRWVYFEIRDNLVTPNGKFPAGSIVRINLSDSLAKHPELIYSAKRGQSIVDFIVNKDRMFINLIDNIQGKIIELTGTPEGKFKPRSIPQQLDGTMTYIKPYQGQEKGFPVLYTEDYLTPEQQYRVHDEDGRFDLELLRSAVPKFPISQFEVQRAIAVGKDGTEIPYSIIKKRHLILDGSNPTLLYGYGGFEVSLLPQYLDKEGKLWLEKGGVYVVANIRGGGEFGPDWHQAALRQNRQRAFDDFIAVAEDLIATKITSPRHLGINGGSNGGLLVAAVVTQRPELFNAALIEVPLTDMLRFSKLLAGASWIGEYGDPDVPEDREYLASYSPYHNVFPNRRYPRVMFSTSTADDRVHPAHARKMAAKMIDQGHSVLYFEHSNGGHSGNSTVDEAAHLLALKYTYLWKQLR